MSAFAAQLVKELYPSAYRGLPFNLYRHLWLERHHFPALTEVQQMIIDARLVMEDLETAEELLHDWRPEVYATITKFVPGEHYYVLGQKFATMEAAQEYAEEQGKIPLDGVQETFVYTTEGG
jgi:hypothetical protein